MQPLLLQNGLGLDAALPLVASPRNEYVITENMSRKLGITCNREASRIKINHGPNTKSSAC